MPAATSNTESTPETASDETAGPGRAGLSRAVLWTGTALGTCLAVWAIGDGARLKLGAMPAWLGVTSGAVITWALIVAAAITAAELARRHHRTAGRYALTQGRRGALAGGRAARRGGLAGGRAARHGSQVAWGRAAAWAGRRWQPRQNTRPRRVCAACGNPEGGQFGPLVTDRSGGQTLLIHQAHTRGPAAARDPRGGPAAGTPPASPDPGKTGGTPTVSPAGAGDPSKGTTSMPAQPASRMTPDRRARRAAAALGGTVPDAWGPVVGQAADFEPESDAHLLGWMAGQVTGMAGYAEALIEAYETGVGAVGIDPKGLAALHDVADAAAHAAETMAGARTKFADHYELPREFAANGGLMTHDGRWVTGDGD